MAPSISSINLAKLLPSTPHTQTRNPSVSLPGSIQAQPSSIRLSAANDPTALILQSAMEKINAMFAPHIGNDTLKNAIESGQDMSPEATAKSILSFATQIIGRAEADQTDLPASEQRSREQLFHNIQSGIETGFGQARDILESMQALNGETKTSVDSTYDLVQQGLVQLAALLDLPSTHPTPT